MWVPFFVNTFVELNSLIEHLPLWKILEPWQVSPIKPE